MNFQNALRVVLSTLLFASLTGCKKSETNQASEPVAVFKSSPDTVARIHWLGKKRLDLDADAYYFSRIWSLPETSRLQGQTFDKLATGTWRALLGDSAGAQIPAAVLRPLMDDLALDESYFELRVPTNSLPQFCFAIHVNAKRAGLWETNLAIAGELLTGGSALPDPGIHGWTINQKNSVGRVMLSRVGEWTILGDGPEKNPLFDEVFDRILHGGGPAPIGATNFWLEADVDLNRLPPAFSFSSKARGTLPSIELRLTGDGSHVITRGHLIFPDALPIQQPGAWHIPTNLIHEPLLGFTSLRGIQPLLAKWKMWNDLQISNPPDQLFFWSLSGSPFRTYVASPSGDAAQEISILTDFLLQKGNPWLTTNGYISFNRAPDSNGVVWGDMPSIRPFIKSNGDGVASWLYAGLLPESRTKTDASPPAQMLQNLAQQTNLVCYNWELTGQLLSPRLAIGQTIREIARKPLMPTDSASLNWLGVLIPRLGSSETFVNRTGTNELEFYRKSTIGFTAMELHLVADWLESPQFPRGMHSLP